YSDDEDTPPNPKKEIFNTTHYRASAAMEYPYDVPDYAHMAMEASEFHPSSGINAEWPLWPGVPVNQNSSRVLISENQQPQLLDSAEE
ncbi:hypothetical protein, partial [Escherichia coli]|uniref:hypothetical protein n=1 Tax=Escherichia coli TaxID=562 RepID=UPI001FF40CC2